MFLTDEILVILGVPILTSTLEYSPKYYIDFKARLGGVNHPWFLTSGFNRL